MKVTDPCGAAREAFESVTREEVINMVGIVRGEIIKTKEDLVSLENLV